MPLSPSQIATLSRLLDEVLDLPAAEREAWLAALPEEQRALLPPLRDMLTDHTRMGSQGRLPTLPRLDAEAPSARTGERVGAYRLLREIGHGGMGSVWLAERADGVFERQVAIKLPRLTQHPGLAERMARERQIGALLEHPHIARLYDAGIDEHGRPYLVMEHLQGMSLLEHCDSHRLDVRQRLQLFLQVCAAVEHAHQHLVVHRDLKPANVMVDEAGQVKLLDFGIAKLLDAQNSDGTLPTPVQEGGRAHTPRYAAPEQLQGLPVATVTDVYSLGVLLYELLTGALPYGDDIRSGSELARAVLEDEPIPPSRARLDAGRLVARKVAAEPALRKSLAGDIDRVVLHALRKRPAERYGSVAAMALDVTRLLAHQPLVALPTGTAQRLALFLRRHRTASIAAGLGLAVLAGVAGLAWQRDQEARAQQLQSAKAREFIVELLQDADPWVGQTGSSVTALQMLDGAVLRAREQLAAQPRLQGEVLSQIAVMFRRLDQIDKARPLSKQAYEMLLASSPPGDAALNQARAQWALMQWQEQRELALNLAQQSLDACRADTTGCARARGYAQAVFRLVRSAQGRAAEAIGHAAAEVDEYRRGLGEFHPETIRTMSDLAVEQRKAGQLLEAAITLERVATLATRTRLRAADNRDLRTRQAAIALDLGRYDDARARLQALLAEPAPAEFVATQHRLLAQGLAAQGLLDEAAAEAGRGLERAAQAGSTWETALGSVVRGAARAALGDATAAQSDLRAADAAFDALGMSRDSVQRLRARRMAGEAALRAGDLGGAAASLEPLPAAHRRTPGAPPTSPVDLAQALDLLGCLARQRGDLAAASQHHAEAAALLSDTLPAEHLLRLRNSVYAALARGDALPPAGQPTLQEALDRYTRALPAASAWRKAAEAATTTEARRRLVL